MDNTKFLFDFRSENPASIAGESGICCAKNNSARSLSINFLVSLVEGFLIYLK